MLLIVTNSDVKNLDLLLYYIFRSPSELINWLKPLFKLDTKTQRGFMACIKLDDLEMALGVENILLEIKLATLQYYFEMCQYQYEVNTIYLSHLSC